MKNENQSGKVNSIGNNVLQNFIGLHHKVYVDETILIYILNSY